MESQDGKQRLGGWRGILSASVIVLLVLPLVWLAFLCVAHRPLPNWLEHSGIPRSLAGRHGVNYSLGSLRVGCFPLALEARDAQIAFDLPELVQHLRNLRLAHARRLLARTTRPVNVILFECGFNDPAAFYRAFRESQGCTPQQWRDGRRAPSANASGDRRHPGDRKHENRGKCT
jgi:AraC-like DNA-binding protein